MENFFIFFFSSLLATAITIIILRTKLILIRYYYIVTYNSNTEHLDNHFFTIRARERDASFAENSINFNSYRYRVLDEKNIHISTPLYIFFNTVMMV